VAVVAQDETRTAVPDGLGWLLALRAVERLEGVTHVRVTSHVAGPRDAWDHPTRERVAAAVRHGASAVVDGAPVAERVAERRWLAWFPRPVGPRHAVNVGGPSVAVLAGLPGVRLVRSHLTTPSWQAEVLQAAANAATGALGGRILDRWVERGRAVDDAEVRWACVVEASADERRLVRAWSHGWAPVATSTVVARVLHATGTEHAPFDLASVDAREVLDLVSAETDLRWSITGPDDL